MEEQKNEIEAVEADALQLGRRLGLLLAAADMPDEQKEAWAALVPEMTAQQMADFAEALERRIPDSGEKAFATLAARLENARSRYGDRVAEATDDAHRSLADLEDEFSPPAA